MSILFLKTFHVQLATKSFGLPELEHGYVAVEVFSWMLLQTAYLFWSTGEQEQQHASVFGLLCFAAVLKKNVYLGGVSIET